MGHLGRFARLLPGYSALRDHLIASRMRENRGVFESFTQAERSIPSRRKVGYNNDESADKYINLLEVTKPSDYAAFYWLGKILPDIRTLFDFGGNLGWSYYSFQKYLQYPERLRWTICDVPAVVKAGARLAVERGASHLRFATDFRDCDGADVLYSSGTLMYVERDLRQLLGELQHKPSHLLLNRVALSEHPTFFTVQDIGSACCPYRIANREEFVKQVQTQGYELVDSWGCAESSCLIRGRRDLAVNRYSGLYFHLKPDAATGSANA